MAIAATIAVDLVARTEKFRSDLQQTVDRVSDVGKSMVDTGKTLTAGLTAPIAAVGAALFASTIKIGNMADALLDLSAQTGLTTDKLQEYRHVATVAGVAQDAVANAANMMGRQLNAAGEDSLRVSRAMEVLGLQTRNADGSLRNMDDMMPEIISSLQGMQNQQERNSLATQLFGRAALDMIPILSMSAEEFDGARESARRLGLVLSKDALNAANDFRIRFDTLRASAAGVASQFGLAVMPVFEKLVDILQSTLIPIMRRAAEALDNLSEPTKTLIAVFAGLVAAIGPVMIAVGKLLPLMAKLFALFAANPIGIVLVALAALAIAFTEAYQRSETLRNLIDQLTSAVSQRFAVMVTNIMNALRVIPDFFIRIFGGAFEAVFSIMTSAVGRILDTVGRFLPAGVRDSMTSFRDTLVGGVQGAVSTAQRIINELRAPSLDLGVTGSNAAAQSALYGPIISASQTAGQVVQDTGEALAAAMQMQVGELATSRTAMGMNAAALQIQTVEIGNATRSVEFMTKATEQAQGALSSIAEAGVERIGKFLGQFSPMSLAMEALGEVFKVLQPIIDQLKAPFLAIAQILARALIPIFQALWPVIRFLAIAISYVAEVIFTIIGNFARMVGGVIQAIGGVIARIPLLGSIGRGIQEHGRNISNIGDGFKQSAKDMKDLRDTLRGMDFEPTDEEDATSALLTESVKEQVRTADNTERIATALEDGALKPDITVTVNVQGGGVSGDDIAQTVVEQIDRALGTSTLRQGRLAGTMIAL